MARSFNVSAVFNAVNNFTRPLRDMSNSLSQFTQRVRASSSPARTALTEIGNSAQQTLRNFTALNAVHLGNLRSQISSVSSSITSLRKGVSSTGSALIGMGAAGGAAVYGINRFLDPQREKEMVQGLLGMEFSKGIKNQDGSKASIPQKMAVGQEKYNQAAKIAALVPGGVSDIGNLIALLKRTKVFDDKSSYQDIMATITKLTDALPAMGKGTMDEEVIRGLSAASIGNISDLIEKIGLRHVREKGMDGFRVLETGQRVFFKSQRDLMKYIIDFSGKKYGGMSEIAKNSTGGIEAGLLDNVDIAKVKIGEQSGFVELYRKKIIELTSAIQGVDEPIVKRLKPIISFFNSRPELFNKIAIGIPSLIAAGVALKIISYALGGFALITNPFAWLAVAAGFFWLRLSKIEQSNLIDSISAKITNLTKHVKAFIDNNKELVKWALLFAGAFLALRSALTVISVAIGLICSPLGILAIALAAGYVLWHKWDDIADMVQRHKTVIVGALLGIGIAIVTLGATVGMPVSIILAGIVSIGAAIFLLYA